jgi:hypothetical protein
MRTSTSSPLESSVFVGVKWIRSAPICDSRSSRISVGRWR